MLSFRDIDPCIDEVYLTGLRFIDYIPNIKREITEKQLE
jgi:hypothetical protein